VVGTRFICALTGKLPPGPVQAGIPEEVLPGLPQTLEARSVWQGEKFRLGYRKYDAYPVTYFESQEFLLYLEGRLYGRSDSQVRSDLLHLAHLATTPGGHTASLANWLRDTDGDFLIFIFDKRTDTIFVVNDPLARLPTYYYRDGQNLIISRDMDYVRENLPKAGLDPMALTQYLVFGFPLGPRTLFEDIYILPPASLITIDVPRPQATMATLVQHNLEDKHASPKSVSHNAGHLVDIFRVACAHRTGGAGSNVVSLSGGLDSRAVVACLQQESERVAAASFLDHRGDNKGDFQVARQVASHLRLPWYSFQLSPPREQEVRTLLHLKQGANNLEMSFILVFLASLLRTFGPDLTYFTGDGGGDTLGESRPYRKLGSPAELLDYLLERYQIFPPEAAASLTGVPVQALVTCLSDLVASYPEITPARKYQHFFCLEVAVKQYHEGEDRNRQYFWSVSPFYSPPFFTYALGCPDHQKLGLRLYQKFLGILSPGLDQIPYADWDAPLGSWKFYLLYAAKNLSRMRPEFTRRLKKVLWPQNHHVRQLFPAQALKRQVLTSPALTASFSEVALKDLVQRIDTLSIRQKWTLFTLTSLIGEVSPWNQTHNFAA
jgi:asparagine synthase (glutamine-hydrolysing)